MSALDDVIDALAASNTRYRAPDPHTRAVMQQLIDEACERLPQTKARELARVWLPRERGTP